MLSSYVVVNDIQRHTERYTRIAADAAICADLPDFGDGAGDVGGRRYN
jgi:hypothetical protein